MAKTGEQAGNKVERNADGTLKKGSTANPNGSPKKGTSVAELLRKKAARKVLTGKNKGKTYGDAIAEAILDKAQGGDLKAADLFYDRIEGKPHQTIAQTTETKAEVRVIE